MKKVLFVINTMGTGGAEKALLEMLEHLKGQDLSIDLYVLLGRGELMARIPKHVRLLNRKRDCGSVLDSAGRRALAGRTAAKVIAIENEIFASWTKEDVKQYLSLTERYLEDFRERLQYLKQD